jgi:hypothetical protein
MRFWFQQWAIWLAGALIAIAALMAGLNQRRAMSDAWASGLFIDNIPSGFVFFTGLAALALVAGAFWSHSEGSGKLIIVLAGVFAAALLFDITILIFGVLGYVVGKPVVSELERLTSHKAKSYFPPYDAILLGALLALIFCTFFFLVGNGIQIFRFAKSGDVWNFLGFFAAFLSVSFVILEFFLGFFAQQRQKGFGYAVMTVVGIVSASIAVLLGFELGNASGDEIGWAIILFPVAIAYLAAFAAAASIGLSLVYSGLVSEPKGLVRLAYKRGSWLDGVLVF